MSNRPSASQITDDQLDQLYAQLDQARRMLSDFASIADVTHKYRIMGGHDTLGADHACAGCALHIEVRTWLEATR